MAEFLLEILCDEMPPDLQKLAVEQIVHNFEKNDIKIAEAFHGTRRLIFNSLWSDTKARIEEKIEKGPRKCSSEEILTKFCEKWKVSRNELEIREYKGVEYFCYKQSVEISEKDFLLSVFLKVLNVISFSRQMDWPGNNGMRWVRPIVNILILYKNNLDDKFVSLDFEFAGVCSSNYTFGHQILTNNRKILLENLSNSNEYYYELARNFVIASQEDRRERILLECRKFVGFEEKICEKLIDELICIAEYPKVMLCNINQKYLKLPHKLIAYTMIINQRYIPLYKNIEKSELSGQFLVIIDHNNPNDEMKNGYERVLTARLEDAEFFWNLMSNRSFEELIELNKSTHSEYNPQLSIYDFNIKLWETIDKFTTNNNITKDLLQIVSCDLSTEVVSEFPALRGIIAADYLNAKSENQKAFYAYNSYYRESELSESQRNLLSESEDAECCRIIVFFKYLAKIEYYLLEKNQNPTASKDPFGLFNAASNLLEIALYPQNLTNYVSSLNYPEKTSILAELDVLQNDKIKNFLLTSVINFITSKFDSVLDKKIIELILSKRQIDSFRDIFLNLDQFSKYKNVPSDFLQAYKRICNLNKRYSEKYTVERELLEEEEEKALYFEINQYNQNHNSPNYSQLTNVINQFLDRVRIEIDNPELKNNRIALVKKVYDSVENHISLEKLCILTGNIGEK